jgi:hypothetical protein
VPVFLWVIVLVAFFAVLFLPPPHPPIHIVFAF